MWKCKSEFVHEGFGTVVYYKMLRPFCMQLSHVNIHEYIHFNYLPLLLRLPLDVYIELPYLRNGKILILIVWKQLRNCKTGSRNSWLENFLENSGSEIRTSEVWQNASQMMSVINVGKWVVGCAVAFVAVSLACARSSCTYANGGETHENAPRSGKCCWESDL